MSPRSQCIIVALALIAAFLLFWFHRDGGATFLAFIGGSPIAASAASAMAATKKPIEPLVDPPATPATPTNE